MVTVRKSKHYGYAAPDVTKRFMAHFLQFQYLALVRYCQNAHTMRKPLQDALTESKKRLASAQDFASKEHAKVLALQKDNEKYKAVGRTSDEMEAEMKRLQGVENEVDQYRRLNVNPKDLETFKNNKDAIRHYLKLVPMLIE
jgi:succinate dehydrogenase/fumarate reductase flavoprotein subunit